MCPLVRKRLNPTCCKWSLALMVGFPVVESVHPGVSLRLDMVVCIYLDLFQDYSALFFQ
jgi:hypothetical protein